jgi:hypothetical protein
VQRAYERHIRKGESLSRIVYGDACIRCACAVDDDGVLYCSEDVCIREGTADVNESCVQQTTSSGLVGSSHAQRQVSLSGLQAVRQDGGSGRCAPYRTDHRATGPCVQYQERHRALPSVPQQAAPGERRQALAPPVSAISSKDIATGGHPLFQVCAK